MKVNESYEITVDDFRAVFKEWHERNQVEPNEYGEMEDYTSDKYAEMTAKTFLEILKDIRDESK